MKPDCPKSPGSAAAWRRKHDPDSLEALQARLAFLYSRVNSHSDPDIQKLIRETRARISERGDAIREARKKEKG
jgi:hypothetical protein